VVVTGGTVSPNFPTTPGVLFPTQPGGVDGFVAKIDSAGSQLIASTYFGSAIYDQSYIVGTDKTDHVYLFGQTSAFDNTFSLNSPISVPGGNQFLSKLSPDLSSMVWSTTFGNATGMPDISPTALLVDVCDKIYVTGWGGIINGFGTSTSGLPVTADAFQSNTDGNDFYLYVIDNQAQNIEYASFLGGTTSFDHVDGGTSRFDRKGVIYQSICAGCGGLSDLPVTPNAYSATNNASNCNNALVKFDFESPITVSAFVNADDPVGCAPYTVNFENTSVNADVFSWRLGNQEIGTSQNLSYTFQNSGTYEVVLIASSTLTCNESDTVSITITVLSQISGSLPELEACAGTTLTLGPNTFTEPYFDFNWYPGTGLSDDQVRNPQITLDSSITYQLVISVGSCTDTLVQNLTALGGSRQSLEDISLCLFDSTTIGLDIPYPGTPQYIWSPQTDIQVLNGYQAIVFPEADQNYELLVDLGNGCADTFDVAVDVRMDPIDAGPDVDACEGQTLSIGAPGDPTAYHYNWSPSAGLNDATAANPMATVSNDITYTLFRIPLPGTPGCPGIDSLAVNIVPKPLAGFFSESFAGCKGVSVAFTDTSLNAQSLRWEFSTGDISTDSKPEIVFPFSDTLKVTLIAENGECRDTMLYSEFIEGLTQYFKENDANAFSPNGDGVNDCFSPALQNLPKPHDESFAACSDLAIYDRWGLKLYDSAYGPENVNTCWNGKNEKGELMPDGVYFYVFHFDGKERAGTVHLRLGE
jgi:gliding motility-associated-like protein